MYGERESLESSEDNQKQFWVPPGFAHGFFVLSESADLLYKTTKYSEPAHELCISWADPQINVLWPLTFAPHSV